MLFAGALALANVPQLPDWTKEKVPARVENALGGSFMSVDPVLMDSNTGASFNRYVYAENNPFKYIDPDGRQAAYRKKRPYAGAEENGERNLNMWVHTAAALRAGAAGSAPRVESARGIGADDCGGTTANISSSG